MTAIATEGLEKRYGDLRALADLTLSVESGELFGLLGPNGAGKSTAIGILTGQLLPDSGRVSVLGTDPTVEPVETRRRVGILPERESPPSFMTPRSTSSSSARFAGFPRTNWTNASSAGPIDSPFARS